MIVVFQVRSWWFRLNLTLAKESTKNVKYFVSSNYFSHWKVSWLGISIWFVDKTPTKWRENKRNCGFEEMWSSTKSYELLKNIKQYWKWQNLCFAVLTLATWPSALNLPKMCPWSRHWKLPYPIANPSGEFQKLTLSTAKLQLWPDLKLFDASVLGPKAYVFPEEPLQTDLKVFHEAWLGS